MEHINKVLNEYEINTNSQTQHNIIFNFNATNPNNIHEQDQEDENEVNYLNTDNEFTHVTEINEDNVIESQSQTQDLFPIFPDNPNENVSLSCNISLSR